MDFGDKNLNDFFGGIFGNKGDLFIDQEVTASLNAFTTVRGVLVSKPTTLNPFCVVDGWLTKSGTETRDMRILVPLNLLKAKP